MDGRPALSRRRQDGRAADGRLPLVERMLGRLPGLRLAWVLAWTALPLVAGLLPGAYLATVGAKPVWVRLLIGLVYAYAVVLAFWALGRFTSDSDTVERSLDQLAAGPDQAATPVFGGLASTWGPLALALVFTAVTVWRTAVLGDLSAALLWLPISFLVNLPLMTAVWVYLALLLGLNRLGRRTLSLTPFPEDLSLGLGEVGRLAFTAFWIYGAGFAPVLLINLANPVRLLLLLGLFLLGVLVFFGCLQGLHRQLLSARRHYLEWAGQLYAHAYEPIRSGSLAALAEQVQALQAAEVIQRRAEAIQEWPFQQRRLAQIAAIVGTVVTFVITGIITRLILVRFGL
jgi:multisubunit Na+/H+ antiporter MnhC subunit